MIDISASTATSRTRRWAWLLVLVLGSGIFLAFQRTLVMTQNPNFVPSVILLGAAVVPTAFLTFVYGRRLPFHVTVPVVAAAAFGGGMIGVLVAGILEYDALSDLGTLPMLLVALIEELSKLLVPVLMLLSLPRCRTRADGLLIGVATGAGFAALETMGYAFTTLINSQGSITQTVEVLLLRSLLSPAGHMAWTGLTAAALFAAAGATTSRRRSVVEVAVTFVIAVTLHTLWDSVGSSVATALVAMVSLALLGLTVHRARDRALVVV